MIRAMLGMRVISPTITNVIWVDIDKIIRTCDEIVSGLKKEDFEATKRIYLYCKYYLVRAQISDFNDLTGKGEYIITLKL